MYFVFQYLTCFRLLYGTCGFGFRLFTRASSNVDRRSFGGASSTTASNSSSGAVSIPPSSGNNDPRSTMTSSASSSSLTSRRERLLDSIFRPPYDIMFPGDFFSVGQYFIGRTSSFQINNRNKN